MINVTKTFLPPIEDYNKYIYKIFQKSIITNRGEFVLELENKLKKYLSVKNIIATTNGTLPLQIAIKTLRLSGEIITTPFSYIATTSSIVWEGCRPVFVDIDEEYLTIDENKIESAITNKTTAILVTHVFGNPCNVEAIEKISKKHNLFVIYDAAHCFGVKYKGESIFNFGDLSTCSFHATKLFHTGEGGAIFTQNDLLNNEMFESHNFGHITPDTFGRVGINAKMSELQAALGLSILPYIDEIILERKRVVDIYKSNLNFDKIKFIKIRENTDWNYSYFPIIFKNEEKLLEIKNALNINNINPRRYFYPSLNTINYIKGEKMPISESISKRILCLPLYPDLKSDDCVKIANIINALL